MLNCTSSSHASSSHTLFTLSLTLHPIPTHTPHYTTPQLDNLQRAAPLRHPHSAYITTLITPKGGDIEVDRDALHFLGITQVIEVASRVDGEGRVVYDPEELVLAVGQLLLGQPSTPAAATGMLGGL